MRRIIPIICTVFLLAFASLGLAQTVATDPVGFTTTSLLSNSDTLITHPFTRPPAFTGTVQSVSGNVITVTGSPGWTTSPSPQQFVYAAGTQPNHYYCLISTGGLTKEGHAFAITGNGANTLTVDTTNDNLTGVNANTQFLIIPYWTLGTVFPATDANVSFTPTTATRTFQTQILIPNYNAVGINPSASAIYFFSNNVNNSTNNVGWRILGDNSTPHDDDILIPDGYFIVRNLNNAPTLPLTTVGAVLTKKLAVPELTRTNQPQDNPVSMVRPIAVSLANTGLNPADGSFVATTQTRSFQDQLLVYDNSVASINKSASAIYFYSNNVNNSTNNVGWRLLGDNTTPHDNDMIPAGSAFIIRKAATASGQPVYWTNSPTY